MEEKKNENVYEYRTEYDKDAGYKTEPAKEPGQIKGKKPRLRFRNVLAVILTIVFAAIFTVGTTGMLAVGTTGASLEEAMKNTSFYELRRVQSWAESEVKEELFAKLQDQAFWVDGEYDETQMIDIAKLDAGVHAQNKDMATSYKMADMVIMYNHSVDDELYRLIESAKLQDAGYPEVIAQLEEEFGTTEYYVDNQGYLYAAKNETGVSLDEFLIQMPLQKDVINIEDAYGMILYIMDGDEYPKICYELPEGSDSLTSVGWEEFSGRYMLGFSELTVDDQEQLYYGDYGYTFQYLYKYGKELELLLPASQETLADYALRNPAEVSLMDSYKQLAKAVQTVGEAVATKQYEQTDMTIDATSQPLAFYWFCNGTEYWTNNPMWNSNDWSVIENEISDRYNDTADWNHYPLYIGKYCYEVDDVGCDEDVLFSSFFYNPEYDYMDLGTILYFDYGVEEGWYVIALNPAIYDNGTFLDINPVLWEMRNVYETHVSYTVIYLLTMFIGAIGTTAFGICSFVWAGKRDKSKVRYAGRFATKAPLELLLLLFLGCWIGYGLFLFYVIQDGWFWNGVCFGSAFMDYILMEVFLFGGLMLGFWQVMTLLLKGKSQNMRTNSLIGRAGRGVVGGIAKGAKTSAFTRKCPIEIMLLIFFVCWSVAIAVIATVFDGFAYYSGVAFLICLCCTLVGCFLLALWQILTLVHKGRSGNMKTNSIIGKCGGGILRAIRQAYGNRKITGKLVLWSILFAGVSLIFVGLAVGTFSPGIFIFLLIVFWVVTIGFLMKKCVQRQRVKEGLHEIAGGHLEYQIELDKLSGDDLDMAKDLNNLKEGMENAVERMMKSERMKTDLITNVSHDLKTPLTSIINYVDILKKEDIQDEKIRGYIQILEQKALRLKNLTEDLMEAAKISSGNITLDMQNINLKQLLYQTNAEFEEKFAKRNLSLVCTLPDSDVYIKADSRRIWRVVENLYNNAAKYAQPYSRVYVDGKLMGGKVILIIKNVSEAPLNISADELMERFVRGDVARNTEGSGLGLEIARNLTVMQKGTFEIQLDGDLFKVVLTFDAV